jgi:predicted DNA-binding transcriptional regulator AlpA
VNKPLLNTRQAAEYLGLTVSTLETYRKQKSGPSYIAISSRCVRYRSADLDNYALTKALKARKPEITRDGKTVRYFSHIDLVDALIRLGRK